MASLRKQLRDAVAAVVRGLELQDIPARNVFTKLAPDVLRTPRPCACVFYPGGRGLESRAFSTEHDEFVADVAVVVLDRSPVNWHEQSDRYEGWEEALTRAFTGTTLAAVGANWRVDVEPGAFLEPGGKAYQHCAVQVGLRCSCILARA